MKFIIGTLLLQLPFLAYGFISDKQNKVCNLTSEKTEICQVIIHEGPRSFQYKYEIKRAIPGSPTLIAVPGGPGQGLIGSMRMVKNGDFVPDDFGIILIDPRGTGQNNFGSDPSGEIYTTSKVAMDIIKVIQEERLTNYFIHGQSYGTAVVTVLGSNISRMQISQPRGLILTGVVNHAFINSLEGYNEQLRRLFSMYSLLDQQNIKQSLEKIQEEFGENKRTFAILFINLLAPNTEDSSSDGISNINMKLFFDALAEGNLNSDNQAMTFFRETAKEVGQVQKPILNQRNNLMPEIIKCHELTKNDGMLDIYFDFNQFKLISNTMDCKQKGYSLDRPYNSKEYQIPSVPIFYIQGLLDPATPFSGAKVHYDQQMSQNKVFVQLDNYAHTALIGLWPCKQNLWSAFMGGVLSLKEHIRKCGRPEIKILK